eukprot:213409-Rhodomonas_salina.2
MMQTPMMMMMMQAGESGASLSRVIVVHRQLVLSCTPSTAQRRPTVSSGHLTESHRACAATDPSCQSHAPPSPLPQPSLSSPASCPQPLTAHPTPSSNTFHTALAQA